MSKKALVIILSIVMFTILILMFFYHGTMYDPKCNKQWYLQSDNKYGSNTENMWTLIEPKIKEDIIVAVIDSGIDFNNPELQGRQWINSNEIPNNDIDDDDNGFIDDCKGWSFCEGTGSFTVNNYHGTEVAQIIAAQHNKAGIEGTIGKIDKVKIMDLKVINGNSSLEERGIDNLINSIEYAEQMGAIICNLSLGTNTYSDELYKTINNSKMLFVVSVGNNYGWKTDIDKKSYYPACFGLDNVIAVGASNKEGGLSDESAYGKENVDLLAPGVEIAFINERNNVSYGNGVSYSVPIVTGIAAYIYAIDSTKKAKEVKTLICSTVTTNDTIQNKCKTGGIVNGYEAVNTLIQKKEEM